MAITVRYQVEMDEVTASLVNTFLPEDFRKFFGNENHATMELTMDPATLLPVLANIKRIFESMKATAAVMEADGPVVMDALMKGISGKADLVGFGENMHVHSVFDGATGKQTVTFNKL